MMLHPVRQQSRTQLDCVGFVWNDVAPDDGRHFFDDGFSRSAGSHVAAIILIDSAWAKGICIAARNM
jgi:hypothetical protein